MSTTQQLDPFLKEVWRAKPIKDAQSGAYSSDLETHDVFGIDWDGKIRITMSQRSFNELILLPYEHNPTE